MQNIVLVGFMGSGKTTIGARLAKHTDRYLIDTDIMIGLQNSQSVKNIFDNHGEEYFRQLERHFIKWAEKNIQNAIIATGGGMPAFNSIEKLGKIFYLKIDFESIKKRLTQNELSARPLFENPNKAYELYESRQNIYEKCANISINANQPIENILMEILKYTI
ncbi:hypothetical protein BKH44_08240 [Helicobacter sp. 13S00477-4]|nr:hypothetical protein BKH44_08240 [Helicobacter sp. 13S00477-4]